jgi:hypothetical protein
MGEPAILSTIRQIAVTMDQVASAFAFNGDLLGLEFLFRAGPELAFLDAGAHG